MSQEVLTSLLIVLAFWLIATAIVVRREAAVPYRPGQFVGHDIVSRVDFTYADPQKLEAAKREARSTQPNIYTPGPDIWTPLQTQLLNLPGRVEHLTVDQLPAPLADLLDSATLARLQQYGRDELVDTWEQNVSAYIRALRDYRWVILSSPDLAAEEGDLIELQSSDGMTPRRVLVGQVVTLPLENQRRKMLHDAAVANFVIELQPKIVELTLRALSPTHTFSASATADARNRAEDAVPARAGEADYRANMKLVSRSDRTIKPEHWPLLQAEHRAYLAETASGVWLSRLGSATITLLLTAALAGYVARYQPRLIENHARAIGLAGLVLGTLAVSHAASLMGNPLFFLGTAPTLLAAFVLTIAYDQRFAIGVCTILSVMVTVALGQDVAFFIIMWSGLLVAAFSLSQIRNRSRLITVGGYAGCAMGLAAAGSGLLAQNPLDLILSDSMYSAMAGVAVGFVTLGLLPILERLFKITTGMTLLELADASQPLLRRLALEAPGTYNHSLQVATLSEAAADAVGADSLLCRVASYYHDIGKINKPDYFVENAQGANRHLNLSPSVSLLIIIGHVKDGIELARAYGLPRALHSFIQQHHGTTLVEYFYHQAARRNAAAGNTRPPDQAQYRYPGPKPKSRESAILMLADASESASRAMADHSPQKLETLVHDLAMKRLLDGQFDECGLTMAEMRTIERALVKGLIGIYHGRIAYPDGLSSDAAASAGAGPTSPTAATASGGPSGPGQTGIGSAGSGMVGPSGPSGVVPGSPGAVISPANTATTAASGATSAAG